MTTHQPDTDVVIVGAGFSGLYAIHKLHNLQGLSVVAFEASDTVGGTWNWNRYPGARCDSEGYTYCYSFDRDLLQDWNWSEKYPTWAELLSYLEHVADRFDLRRQIQFNATVTSARFNETSAMWEVTTSDGATTTSRYLVTGVGHLSISPYVPKIENIEAFAGEWYHTARWPREGVNLVGKRVAVIGTGSSGVQAIPEIAKIADRLAVFQRHPQYSIPARHNSVDRAFLDDVKARYDEIWEICRTSAGGFPWQHNGKSALEVSEAERQRVYESLWAEGGMKFALCSFRDIVTDISANETVSQFVRDKIAAIVVDEETRAALLPTDHPFFSRRPIVDTDYFETYNRDNVTLVDLRRTPIMRATERGIETSAGEIGLDVILFATGFDAVTGPLYNLNITGRNGLRLADAWATGPEAYLGLQAVDFPNLFMITGPASINGNFPLMVETHVDWIAACIAHMRAVEADTVEPLVQFQTEWMKQIAANVERSLISHAGSWANGANIPGKARAQLVFMGHFGRYRAQLLDNAKSGFPGLAFHLREPLPMVQSQ